MPFAAATSQHPLASHAVGEVVGAVLDRIGPGPDLAVLFVAAEHAAQLEQISDAVRRLLVPRCLLGATTAAVVGDGHELEDRAAIGLWAAHLGAVRPFRIDVRPGDGLVLSGTPRELLERADTPRTVLLLADPFSFPADPFLERLPGGDGGVQVVGGLVSGGRGRFDNGLVLDGRVHHDGAVGVVLPDEAAVTTAVSQGCRPVGEPFTVTAAERNLVLELGSRPALDRMVELLAELSPDDRELAERGLHVGLVVDEQREHFDRGDFLVRNVLGGDAERRAIAVGEIVEVGTTLQFQVRDADSADRDLRHLLAGRRAEGALLFTCTGRGRRLFGEPDHDVTAVAAVSDRGPVAGMFCAGELGSIAGRNALHAYTAAIALFGGDRDSSGGH